MHHVLALLLLLLLIAVAAGDDVWVPEYAPGVIPLDSPEGYERFRSAAPCAMSALLLSRLTTQSMQSNCGAASVVTVFNALGVRPSPELFGYAFWTQENLLKGTGTSGEVHTVAGINIAQLAYVVSKRVAATAFHAEEHDVAAFRGSVRESLVQCEGSKALTVNFLRAPVTVKGGGHHSVLGAYHNASDSVLLLDVATYKYSPVWIPLPLLHAAMDTPDMDTPDTFSGSSRGWLLIDASDPAHLPPSPPPPPDPVRGFVTMRALSHGAVLVAGVLLGTLLSCCWRKVRARRGAGAARPWVPLGERGAMEGGQGKDFAMTEV